MGAMIDEIEVIEVGESGASSAIRASVGMDDSSLAQLNFCTYPPPEVEPIELTVVPRLESWDRKDHPSQVALRIFLDRIRQLLVEHLVNSEPLALELVVGMPQAFVLDAGGRDLDNYLFPIARELGANRLASMTGEKRVGASMIRVGPCPAPITELTDWSFASAVTTASSQTVRWKEEIAEQVWDQASLALAGPVEMHLCFVVGPHRNWTMLWKPAIDALGCILGTDNPAKRFHPRDDRIVRLGLHRVLDESIGHGVRIGVWWRSVAAHRPVHDLPAKGTVS